MSCHADSGIDTCGYRAPIERRSRVEVVAADAAIREKRLLVPRKSRLFDGIRKADESRELHSRVRLKPAAKQRAIGNCPIRRDLNRPQSPIGFSERAAV